jgi:deoxyhypusine synthase
VPIFTSSPGDSSIGMNLAALQLEGSALRIDPLRDVNQSAAIVYDAKKRGRSGVFILGGGSPKNFILQTEPQIQEVLGLPESGHDYFLQITDARPDTGGLSGATPQEAMTWGKVDPEQLPDTVTCYVDSTVVLPLMTLYALATRLPRPPRRLMDRLPELTRNLEEEYRVKRAKDEATD